MRSPFLLSVFIFLMISSHNSIAQSVNKIFVEVCIDGNSKLHIKGGKMMWEHLQDTEPGMHDMCKGPIKVTGKIWGKWYMPFTLDFNTDSCTITPKVILANEISKMVQAPTAANGWETIWHFNDPSAYPHEYSVIFVFEKIKPAIAPEIKLVEKERPLQTTEQKPAVINKPTQPKTTSPPIAKKQDSIKTEFIPNAVSFGIGTAVLTTSSKTELGKIAAKLKAETGTIEILGHTNNLGEKTALLTLSEARAKAVYDYLASKGIENSRMSYKGYGDTRPIASNETESGQNANRRVEIRIRK